MLFLPDPAQRRISGIGKEHRPLGVRLSLAAFCVVSAGETPVSTGKNGFAGYEVIAGGVSGTRWESATMPANRCRTRRWSPRFPDSPPGRRRRRWGRCWSRTVRPGPRRWRPFRDRPGPRPPAHCGALALQRRGPLWRPAAEGRPRGRPPRRSTRSICGSLKEISSHLSGSLGWMKIPCVTDDLLIGSAPTAGGMRGVLSGVPKARSGRMRA